MSDCSANAWAVPKESGIPRHDGTDELVIDAYATPEQIAGARSLRIRQAPGAVFAKVDWCTLTVEYAGDPCNDYRCSACGKLHNAPRANAFCPRCGARVALVVEKGAQGGADSISEAPRGKEGEAMMELYADLVYEEDQHGLDRLVVHDENGEHADVYYVRVGNRDWDDVEVTD